MVAIESLRQTLIHRDKKAEPVIGELTLSTS